MREGSLGRASEGGNVMRMTVDGWTADRKVCAVSTGMIPVQLCSEARLG